MPKTAVKFAGMKTGGQLGVSQNTNTSTVQLQTLRPRLVTPSEYLVPRFRIKNKIHRPEVIPERGPKNQVLHFDPSSSQSENSMDGFMLLEAAGMTLPDDVVYVILSGKRLTNVVEEDLIFFSNLLYLDLSENSVKFEHFKNLPSLMELRLSCNFIREIQLADAEFCFHSLLSLDLSYNNLTSGSIESLAKLPRLKELDLSGNKLTVDDLPVTMEAFHNLEKLVLENNKLDAAAIFEKLSTAPNLRDLHLAYNFLWKIPDMQNTAVDMSTQHSRQTFRNLEILDIAFNYFGTQDDVWPSLSFPRLKSLVLYGNPVLGPTGEDPHYIYIEDLANAAIDIGLDRRDAGGVPSNSEGKRPPIEVITEMPRKRVYRKGQDLGRRIMSYKNFRIAIARKSESERVGGRLARDWIKEGNATLFSQAMALANNFVGDADSIKVEMQTDACDYEGTFLTRAPNTSPSSTILSTALNARPDADAAGHAVAVTVSGASANNEVSSVLALTSHAANSGGSGNIGQDKDKDEDEDTGAVVGGGALYQSIDLLDDANAATASEECSDGRAKAKAKAKSKSAFHMTSRNKNESENEIFTRNRKKSGLDLNRRDDWEHDDNHDDDHDDDHENNERNDPKVTVYDEALAQGHGHGHGHGGGVLPGFLIHRSMTNAQPITSKSTGNGQREQQPDSDVAMKAALRALRLAVRQPLTNYNEVPAPPFLTTGFGAVTSSSMQRELTIKMHNVNVQAKFEQEIAARVKPNRSKVTSLQSQQQHQPEGASALKGKGKRHTGISMSMSGVIAAITTNEAHGQRQSQSRQQTSSLPAIRGRPYAGIGNNASSSVTFGQLNRVLDSMNTGSDEFLDGKGKGRGSVANATQQTDTGTSIAGHGPFVASNRSPGIGPGPGTRTDFAVKPFTTRPASSATSINNLIAAVNEIVSSL